VRYAIEFAPAAARDLRKLERRVQIRIARVIDSLAGNPRASGASKLTASDAWRIRIGAYRVIYEIKDRQLIVMVLRVAHRREVYR